MGKQLIKSCYDNFISSIKAFFDRSNLKYPSNSILSHEKIPEIFQHSILFATQLLLSFDTDKLDALHFSRIFLNYFSWTRQLYFADSQCLYGPKIFRIVKDLIFRCCFQPTVNL